MNDLPAIVEFWKQRQSEPLALATVVRTSGSTYRRAGARMVVSLEGESRGLVSGGCLEREVIQLAQRTLEKGEARLSSFDTRRLLGCNGAIDVLMELLPPGDSHLLLAAEAALATRRTLMAATIYGTTDAARWPLGSRPLETLAEMLHTNPAPKGPQQISHYFGEGRAELLVHPLRPPVRLVILGAGPDVTPLATLGHHLGWEISVVVHPSQPAPIIPTPCRIQVAGPDEIEGLISPDRRTAVVVMTHNYGRDLAYLARVLPLQLPYVGLLGPRGRRDQLLSDLADTAAPWDDDQLASLHSPVGLDIGAELPEEVALSILGEVQAVFAGRPGGRLRQLKGPVHAVAAA